jgi:formylglycine-generating enzyme required for sulfatase activity
MSGQPAGFVPPHPCCVPSKERAVVLDASRRASAQRTRANTGSTADMVKLDGGVFRMGTEDHEGFPADGEGPIREVHIDPFWLDRYPVTNQQFDEFVTRTGYRSEAERFGWSFVFHNQLPPELLDPPVSDKVKEIPWWVKIDGALWNRPEGPDSSIDHRQDYPVTHVSWHDAAEYARWAGKRLPTEAEWEFAARGGLEQKKYSWGDELTPGGQHFCNIWQGDFPRLDTGEDGYRGPSPVAAFPENGYGIYSLTGNVWEWCADWFHPTYHQTATRVNPVGPATGIQRVMRGGSFLCHKSYCNRYRVAARTSNTPNSSTTNLGFRCARDC